MPKKPNNIDEYLAALPADQRAALQKLRKTILAAAPGAVECISYQLAAFRLGRLLVGFGATPNHCAFYLMSGSTVGEHQAELAGYDTTKSAIHFQPTKPLPASLVRKLVKARLEENASLDAARKKPAPAKRIARVTSKPARAKRRPSPSSSS